MKKEQGAPASEFDAAAVTQSLMERYYSLDVEPWLSALAEDAMWIGPGNLFVFGAEAIRKYFDEIHMPVIHLHNVEISEIYRTDSLSVVVGQYDAMTDEEADGILAVHQRLTFQYVRIKDEWKILHMHVSNEYNELMDDEVYPTKMGRATYRYMQQLLAKKSVDSHRIMLEEDADTRFINTDEIIFVEAMSKKSILHCINKTVVSSKPISVLEEMLPPNFYRAHRSYLVNCNCVTRIARFMLELQGGFTIPLPEKRYMVIREELKALLGGDETVGR